MTPSTSQQRAKAICEKWFDTGARASWFPQMVDAFAQAIIQDRQDTIEEIRGRISEYNHKDLVKGGVDGLLAELDRLASEGA